MVKKLGNVTIDKTINMGQALPRLLGIGIAITAFQPNPTAFDPRSKLMFYQS